MTSSNRTPQTIEIQLTKGFTAIVSAVDADLVQHKWHAHTDPRFPHLVYAERNIPVAPYRQRLVKLHRVVMERIAGTTLRRNDIVDHIDGNTLNCTRDNLRLCDNERSARNRGTFKSNKLGLKGVYKRGEGKYRAQIQVGGKKIMLGQFTTAEQAHEAYREAARKYHQDYARTG